MQAEAAPAVVLLDLPEECLVAVCAAVAASAEAARLPVALARLQASCRALRDLPADRAAWLPACRRRWSARPRWMERLERQLQTEAASGAAGVAVGGSPGAVPFRGGTWRDRLNEAEAEAARPLSAAQLQGMRYAQLQTSVALKTNSGATRHIFFPLSNCRCELATSRTF